MLDQGGTVYWIIIASFVMPLLLSVGLVYFYITYYKKKKQYELDRKDALLREQALKIEKQEALVHERNRIAAEMHDDLGGGLTSISFLSRQLASMKTSPSNPAIQRIQDLSSDLVSNMSEIIWAMDNRFDSSGDLVAYIRRKVSEFLLEFPITYNFKADIPPNWQIKNTARRSIYLLIKEAVHNVVKHAKADQLTIFIKSDKEILSIAIKDNGQGLQNDVGQEGNGLRNMKKRVDEMGGGIQFHSSSEGLKIDIEIPLNQIRMDQ